MIISHKYKLIFITTPKSGSHTGFKLMEKYFEAPKIKFNHGKIVSPKYKHYKTFTFVRNPYERFCALYHACVVNDHKNWVPNYAKTSIENYANWYVSMKERNFYIRADLTSPQTHWHLNCSRIDWFIHIEEAQSFLNFQFPELNIQLPHELKRNHPTWKDVQNDKLRGLINKWAKEDFENYGYECEDYSS